MSAPLPDLVPLAEPRLRNALDLPDGAMPFPWQLRLLRDFLNPDGGVHALDIPTGLGKTSVMAIWLVARSLGANHLPRRLVYVVDRRAVVDQATEVAVALRAWVDGDPTIKEDLGLGAHSLPISTLRGQHIDNREWLDDPSCPAIVVGTVDMVGSRLLFEGYGVSRKMRPYHAGLLGSDTLLVLDEAHLVPAFERLLGAITDGAEQFGAREGNRPAIPRFRLLSLSATGRSDAGGFGLDADDEADPIVSRRINAPKRLHIVDLEEDREIEDVLAEHAWRLRSEGGRPRRVIVFANSREVAVKVHERLRELAAPDRKSGREKTEIDRELLVGERRLFEREQAMEHLRAMGFVAGSNHRTEVPAFVVATSAGEVGVDLDAEHMVSDLVAWERMVQRLGRVNRRGDGSAKVVVIVEPPSSKEAEALRRLSADKYDKDAEQTKDLALTRAVRLRNAARQTLMHLACDGSPAAIGMLRARASSDPAVEHLLDEATTPAPLYPALTRPVLEAWAMTSLREHTGRPIVAPWLRGWVDDEPQTAVLWRTNLPIRSQAPVRDSEVEAFFEAAPPHVSETLEAESTRVAGWLVDRGRSIADDATHAIKSADVMGFVLDDTGDLSATLRLHDLNAKKGREDLLGAIRNKTLIVDQRVAGILPSGMLDRRHAGPPRTSDDGGSWISDDPPVIRFRIRAGDPTAVPTTDPNWRERTRFVRDRTPDGEPSSWLTIEKWREDAATEEDRSAGREQRLSEHEAWTEDRARKIATRLGLGADLVDVLGTAARLHDEGKRAPRWQRAFSAPADGPYAKTRGPLRVAMLEGYRHELGSLPWAEKDGGFLKFTQAQRDLVLHLIAAHHGFARPIISTDGYDEAPPSALAARAQEIALRFIRLQNAWGVWGLAWLESLLRAADQQASRDNDAAGRGAKGGA